MDSDPDVTSAGQLSDFERAIRNFQIPELHYDRTGRAGRSSEDVTYSTWACIYLHGRRRAPAFQQGGRPASDPAAEPSIDGGTASAIRNEGPQPGTVTFTYSPCDLDDLMTDLHDSLRPDAQLDEILRAFPVVWGVDARLNEISSEPRGLQPVMQHTLLTVSRYITSNRHLFFRQEAFPNARRTEETGIKFPVSWDYAEDHIPSISPAMSCTSPILDLVSKLTARGPFRSNRSKGDGASSSPSSPTCGESTQRDIRSPSTTVTCSSVSGSRAGVTGTASPLSSPLKHTMDGDSVDGSPPAKRQCTSEKVWWICRTYAAGGPPSPTTLVPLSLSEFPSAVDQFSGLNAMAAMEGGASLDDTTPLGDPSAQNTVLFGRRSGLVLCAKNRIQWLMELRSPWVFSDTDAESLHSIIGAGDITVEAAGYTAGEEIDRLALSIRCRYTAPADEPDASLTTTVRRVLAQVFQQMVQMACPRLILSTWENFFVFRLGSRGRVHVSGPIRRACAERDLFALHYSPLELILAVELRALRVVHANSAAVMRSPLITSPASKWDYDGQDWFSQPVLDKAVSDPIRGTSGGRGKKAQQPQDDADCNHGGVGDTEPDTSLDYIEPPSLPTDPSNGESIARLPTPEAVETLLVLPSDFAAFGQLDAEQDQLVRGTIDKLKRFDGLPSRATSSEAHHPLRPSPALRLSCLIDGVRLPTHNLMLGRYLGHGRTGIAFKLSHDLIAKLVDVTSSSTLHRHPDRHELNGGSTMRAIRNEALLYVRELAPLQGDVVPQFYGLYSVGDTLQSGLLLLITSYAGSPLGEDYDITMPSAALHPHADAVRRAYARLHAVGVEHVDVAPRHILEHNGSVRIIDFEAAIAPGNSISSKDALCKEAETVETMLRSAAAAAGTANGRS